MNDLREPKAGGEFSLPYKAKDVKKFSLLG
jgi:hypothetical protein